MSESGIEYQPHGTTHFCVNLSTKRGSYLRLRGKLDLIDPEVLGAQVLVANRFLVATTWAYAELEYASRRTRSPDKKKELRKEAKSYERRALSIASLADQQGDSTRSGWCSGCFQLSSQRKCNLGKATTPTYLCELCGTPTTTCLVPKCESFALRGEQWANAPRYCAEHRHDISGFAKADKKLESIDDFAELLEYEKRNVAKATRLTVATVAAGAALAPVAWIAAPVIGGALGASALGGGLSGAAATSHGLAMLGGGSLAAGGLGMAGGMTVLTAAGAALGGALGLTTVNAYLRDDKSFNIQQIRAGTGTPVLLASGFLTENDNGWGTWQRIIDKRFPTAPVYRVHWGAKDLQRLATFVGIGGVKGTAFQGVRVLARQAAKKASTALALITLPVWAADMAKNPWTMAKTRARMTGAVLADLIARSPGKYILVGHSLGAAVMLSAAQTLGTRDNVPKIADVHLLGAAVPKKGVGWRRVSEAVAGDVWNYYSDNDGVLKIAFTTAHVGQRAIGNVGAKAPYPNVHDRNVSGQVRGHSEYFEKVSLHA